MPRKTPKSANKGLNRRQILKAGAAVGAVGAAATIGFPRVVRAAKTS
jgi:hypothetical protein